MTNQNHIEHSSAEVINRITLAWSISECALGGFLHAINSPFTGLMVGGLSVLFICLLAYHSSNTKKDLLQALLFVLGVKMAVSPHSPFGAYFAVSVQALLGVLFFSSIGNYKTAAILTAIFSLLLSAIQKVFILTLLFGLTLWDAIDSFAAEVFSKLAFLPLPDDLSISFWMIAIYLMLYTVGGFMIGTLAANVPRIFSKQSESFEAFIDAFRSENVTLNPAESRPKKFRLWPLVLVFITLGIVLQWYMFSAETAIHQLIRTVSIILLWVLVLKPLFSWVLRRLLKNQQKTVQSELEAVRSGIPTLASFAKYAWKKGQLLGKHKILNFVSIYVYFAIYKL